ncbi:hypothetical protein Ddye_025788 [Dipteronia dyeriana]|uniref:Uncharacterized protein n=1 Tax=Dipteronia dyeriana TaxID=168575 RepID=A0AAD9TLF7_9ROSI|nr:hypothetical protein Ddye_025788 [Dipteronia dyeriana]
MKGNKISHALKDIENDWGKRQDKSKKDVQMWKKISIFFTLPYWKDLALHHNFDLMHIEKNICESVIYKLLEINGKTKDEINARKDLQDLGILHDLHPQDQSTRTYLPPAPHTLSKVEK